MNKQEVQNWYKDMQYLVEVTNTYLLDQTLASTTEADKIVKDVLLCEDAHNDNRMKTRIEKSLSQILGLRKKDGRVEPEQVHQWHGDMCYAINKTYSYLEEGKYIKTITEADKVVRDLIVYEAAHKGAVGVYDQMDKSFDEIAKQRGQRSVVSSKPQIPFKEQINGLHENACDIVDQMHTHLRAGKLQTKKEAIEYVTDMVKVIDASTAEKYRTSEKILGRIAGMRSGASVSTRAKEVNRVDNLGCAHHRAFKSPVVEGAERNPGHRASRAPRAVHPEV